MNDAQEKKQGGRRKGSGRKKKVENRATVKTVSMPDHVWERLNDVCTDRGILRSQVVREAVDVAGRKYTAAWKMTPDYVKKAPTACLTVGAFAWREGWD